MGAAWARPLSADEPGYGYVADDVPEVSMAVFSRYRGAGVGTRMLSELMTRLARDGWLHVSLSVEDGNVAARRLYGRHGFTVVGREGDSDTVVMDLRT